MAGHMAEAAGWLNDARAALDVLDKAEPYCTACGKALLSGTSGWAPPALSS
jgi:hypothetical protein